MTVRQEYRVRPQEFRILTTLCPKWTLIFTARHYSYKFKLHPSCLLAAQSTSKSANSGRYFHIVMGTPIHLKWLIIYLASSAPNLVSTESRVDLFLLFCNRELPLSSTLNTYTAFYALLRGVPAPYEKKPIFSSSLFKIPYYRNPRFWRQSKLEKNFNEDCNERVQYRLVMYYLCQLREPSGLLISKVLLQGF